MFQPDPVLSGTLRDVTSSVFGGGGNGGFPMPKIAGMNLDGLLRLIGDGLQGNPRVVERLADIASERLAREDNPLAQTAGRVAAAIARGETRPADLLRAAAAEGQSENPIMNFVLSDLAPRLLDGGDLDIATAGRALFALGLGDSPIARILRLLDGGGPGLVGGLLGRDNGSVGGTMDGRTPDFVGPEIFPPWFGPSRPGGDDVGAFPISPAPEDSPWQPHPPRVDGPDVPSDDEPFAMPPSPPGWPELPTVPDPNPNA